MSPPSTKKSEPLTKLESSEATAVSAHGLYTNIKVLTEYHSHRLLDRLAESAHWAVHQPSVELLRGVEEIHKQGSFQRSPEGQLCFLMYQLKTHGQSALSRMPSLAWTMASSRVMARTAPLDAVSERKKGWTIGNEIPLTCYLRGCGTHDRNEGRSVDDGPSNSEAFTGVRFVLRSALGSTT